MKYEFDADYKQMYLTMFNAATDAVSQIMKFNMGHAASILLAAQSKCEEVFIEYDDEPEDDEENSELDFDDEDFTAFVRSLCNKRYGKQSED